MKLSLALLLACISSAASATGTDSGAATQYNTRLQEMLETTGWNFSNAIDTKQIANDWQANQARAQIKFSKPGIYHGRISKVLMDNLGVKFLVDQGKSTAVTVLLESSQAWPWNVSGNQLKVGGIQSSLEFAANFNAGQEMYFQCRRVQFGLGVYLSNCLAFPPSIARSNAKPEVHENMDVDISLDEVIKARAAEGWARPASARRNMKVTLQINMLSNGTITAVNVAQSSGDTPFDNSAVAAVQNIGELPEVQSMKRTDMSRYRKFNVTFTPDDLNL